MVEFVLFVFILIIWSMLNVFLFVSGLFNHNLAGKYRIMYCVAFVVSSVAMAFIMSDFHI